MSLQLIGSVRVAGRTIDEITDELTTRYAKELVQPQVTVAVKEYSGLKVYVGGEVNTPGHPGLPGRALRPPGDRRRGRLQDDRQPRAA